MKNFNSKTTVETRSNNYSKSGDDASESSDEEKGKDSITPTRKHRKEMTAKTLDIRDAFKTIMFHNKKTLEMAKMLHTMKENMSFTENNVEMIIDSRGIEKRNSENKEKNNYFEKS